MRKIILLLLLISFTTYSQGNQFTGTWSNENCKDCSKKYILKLNISQSYRLIFGTAEVINTDETLSTGIMEITGWSYALGDRTYIRLKGLNGIGASVVLSGTNEGALEFSKTGGSNLIPSKTILTKLYD